MGKLSKVSGIEARQDYNMVCHDELNINTIVTTCTVSRYSRFNVNYGGLGFLDWLHGTDYCFRGTVEEKRHFTFYSLTKSIKDIIPDQPRQYTRYEVTEIRDGEGLRDKLSTVLSTRIGDGTGAFRQRKKHNLS